MGQDTSPSLAQAAPSALVLREHAKPPAPSTSLSKSAMAPQALVFKASSLLQEKIPDAAKRTQPSFVQANSMSGQTNLNLSLIHISEPTRPY